jgi:hypothetical protein
MTATPVNKTKFTSSETTDLPPVVTLSPSGHAGVSVQIRKTSHNMLINRSRQYTSHPSERTKENHTAHEKCNGFELSQYIHSDYIVQNLIRHILSTVLFVVYSIALTTLCQFSRMRSVRKFANDKQGSNTPLQSVLKYSSYTRRFSLTWNFVS